MKKFVIHTFKSKTSILEVECEYVLPLEDPSILWLPTGEFKVKISAPDCLLEKRIVGKDTFLDPVIYCSHAIYDNGIDALAVAAGNVRKSLMRDAIKKHLEFKEEDAIILIKDIEIKYL